MPQTSSISNHFNNSSNSISQEEARKEFFSYIESVPDQSSSVWPCIFGCIHSASFLTPKEKEDLVRSVNNFKIAIQQGLLCSSQDAYKNIVYTSTVSLRERTKVYRSH